jgi:hypothetical protein
MSDKTANRWAGAIFLFAAFALVVFSVVGEF